MYKAFQAYVGESKMPESEYKIDEKQYAALDFMNEVPEIVCDVLFHLTGFVHYRTTRFSSEVYERFLLLQN